MNIDKMNKIQNEDLEAFFSECKVFIEQIKELEAFFSEYKVFIEQIEAEKKAEEKRLERL